MDVWNNLRIYLLKYLDRILNGTRKIYQSTEIGLIINTILGWLPL